MLDRDEECGKKNSISLSLRGLFPSRVKSEINSKKGRWTEQSEEENMKKSEGM